MLCSLSTAFGSGSKVDLYGWGILSELAAQEVHGPHHHEEKSKVCLLRKEDTVYI